MILESPESVLKVTNLQPVATQAAGTDNSASIDNKAGRGNVLIQIDHGATASGHTLAVTVQHSDDDTTFTPVLMDDGTTEADFDVAASQTAGTALLRLRADRLKRYVRVSSVVVGGSGVDVSIWAIQMGLDSADCDGAAAYEILL